MEQLNRRDFLKLVGIGAAGAALYPLRGFAKNNFANRNMNIIYILADDLGYGELGCYGQKRIKTPNIDRMAKEGMMFTDHYAGSTVCAPSRCCLMTGYHTGHADIRGNSGGLSDEITSKLTAQMPIPEKTKTVAECLKEGGYKTALIGKWGLGDIGTEGHPNKQGFDYFFGYLDQRHAHNYYPEYLFRNEEKVRLEGNRIDNPFPYGEGIADKREQYSHDLFTEESLKYIEQNKKNPFFLYLALTIPHANNRGGDNGRDIGMEVPDLGIYEDKDWPFAEKGKAAMITRMDKDIGRLLTKLENLGIAENTIVIFSSDNGPHKEGGAQPDFSNSSGPFRGIKRDLYEGGIRIPMIAWSPGNIKPNSKSDHVSAFWDFLPTACEIGGVSIPQNIDGISFLPELLGKKQKEHEYLYWEFFDKSKIKQAVRIRNYKFVRPAYDDDWELYDLETDIGEKNNIVNQYPGLMNELKKILKNVRSESEYWKMPYEVK